MQWLTDLFSDPATIQIVVVLIAGLAAAALGLGILSLATGASDPIRRRLNKFAGNEDLGDGRRVFNLNTILGPVTQYIVPSKEIERSKVIEQLTFAGHRSPSAMQTFYSIKAVLTVVFPAVVFAVSYWMPELSFNAFLFLMIGSAATG